MPHNDTHSQDKAKHLECPLVVGITRTATKTWSTCVPQQNVKIPVALHEIFQALNCNDPHFHESFSDR